MNITFEGLSELLKECEKVASEQEINKTNTTIVNRGAKLAKGKVEKKIRRSKNVNRSGRKGSRTGKHAADNVPVSNAKTKDGYTSKVVGWEKGDNSPYFYMKFEEWGTSKRPPYPVFLNTSQEIQGDFKKIAEEEYQKLLNKTLNK